MGWFFRRSIKLSDTVRFGINKRSVSLSTRAGPVTRTVGSSGRRSTSVRLPGGFRWQRRK